MVIIVDFDSVMVDTHTAVLKLYREETGDLSTNISDETGWEIAEICPKWTKEQCRTVFKNPRLFALMRPFEGARIYLNALVNQGHRVVICTVHGHEGIGYKGAFIKGYFPFIEEVIYCDTVLRMKKDLIKGDILLDDNIDNLSTTGCEYAVCFGKYAWNKAWEGLRVSDWMDAYGMVLAIAETKELLSQDEVISTNNFQ